MKPRIGISLNFRADTDGQEQVYLDRCYYDYVIGGGGAPFPLVPTLDGTLRDALLDGVDGVMLTGGYDLDSSLWSEPLADQATLLHPHRAQAEMLLYEHVLTRQLPVLGICLGAQLINVHHGGSLHQHLPNLPGVIDHQDPQTAGRTEHDIEILRGTTLHDCAGASSVRVNSYHHQGINRLAEAVIASGRAPDGIVEAIELPNYPFLLAVQWHPERDMTDPLSVAMMAAFLHACESIDR